MPKEKISNILFYIQIKKNDHFKSSLFLSYTKSFFEKLLYSDKDIDFRFNNQIFR
jgi:hypothetical protein